MDRKWIGVVLSLVLAAAGTWVLVQYVNGADERALEGVETVDVLVVSDTIPEGASISDVGARVERQQVPVSAQAAGSVDSLSGLQGTVTAVALVPGEQVIASRFVTPQELAQTREFEIPDELLAVTLSLSPDATSTAALANRRRRHLGRRPLPSDPLLATAHSLGYRLHGARSGP